MIEVSQDFRVSEDLNSKPGKAQNFFCDDCQQTQFFFTRVFRFVLFFAFSPRDPFCLLATRKNLDLSFLLELGTHENEWSNGWWGLEHYFFLPWNLEMGRAQNIKPEPSLNFLGWALDPIQKNPAWIFTVCWNRPIREANNGCITVLIGWIPA